MGARAFQRLALLLTVWTFMVVVLGATVRLMDAGLGCPDWPGCYGRLVVPQSEPAISQANLAFPERPVEVAKGWWEMAHRYVAGLLGLMILALAVLAWRRRQDPWQPVALPVAVVFVVLFQSVLGAWTVTWQLKPIVVVAHLLGGLAVLALLWWTYLRSRRVGLAAGAPAAGPAMRAGALVVLAAVVGQVALGGWVSANYAALACTDFPTCNGSWWPRADFAEAFVLWRGLGVNYEFGILDNPARVAIQLSHRIGAVVVVGLVVAFAIGLLRASSHRALRRGAWLLLALTLAQFALGAANVLLSLPLGLAAAHTAGAALLLLATVHVTHLLFAPTAEAAAVGGRSRSSPAPAGGAVLEQPSG
ncbi:COX15/CtaA family protein [Alkalilimnicola ehrlichii MLHE-1]|uniref:Cytochrome oxidase assembly n=1 Tax=Alkalilimnicola ehrlichii (strain ATCC BAA-1101 / DSM 17681 / MLHE-1) TaxID=187272 RepID=Q0ABY2_ALKEH|nr:COX15/CtaA family protein [Alkalilimnicola ehrlichii]ABI55655.1 cytochrome oxidase assembly [Alkalilimnicola ehrlichii MLHE-1]